MLAMIVRFKTELSRERLFEMSREREPQYRALTGLKQKYYLQYGPGEFGAVYIWESEADMKAFRESELARSIPAVYKVQGTPSFERGDVLMLLRS
jgi:heme-degrading monooxygenase HmoA